MYIASPFRRTTRYLCRYRGVDQSNWDRNDPQGYLGNLARLDRLIGEYMTALKPAGRFDQALIILTSDHSWRLNPERQNGASQPPVTHVPLVAKLPRQAVALCIGDRFENRALGGLIRFALGSDGEPQKLASWVRSNGGAGSSFRPSLAQDDR